MGMAHPTEWSALKGQDNPALQAGWFCETPYSQGVALG